MNSFEDLVVLAAKTLAKANVPYALVGGFAVGIWGTPRASVDIDIILMLKKECVSEAVKVFNSAGFSVSEKDVEKSLKEKSHFTVFDNNSTFYLDCKGAYTEFDKETVKRRKKISISGTDVSVASPETVVASKLVFGSDRDIDDARSILVRHEGKLEYGYLEEACEELGVLKEYKMLKKETDEA